MPTATPSAVQSLDAVQTIEQVTPEEMQRRWSETYPLECRRYLRELEDIRFEDGQPIDGGLLDRVKFEVCIP